ncbi:uncharacterized protein LOC129235121 [Uloborus diversus]|uniref:uncharacterized protein LOC129235121 n=1 Tax=Uloborus diversus TaxID=327109 RepID=UPI00240A7498|nr:uncharacterized protein LOC129235121 [Uloborus diversus]
MGLKFWSILLLAVQLIVIPQSASAFGGLFGGHHGGRSEVAEILAAGIITKLLMEEYSPRPTVMHALSHGMMGGYTLELPRPHMHSLMMPRMPMMHPYALSPMLHHPNIYMQQATLMHHARKQALESSLKEEIRALEASESLLNAYLASNGDGEATTLEELLSEDDSLPAAALLLEAAELGDQEEKLTVKADAPVPDVIEAAGSENESRYILPRIARYFVQRLLRRAESH